MQGGSCFVLVGAEYSKEAFVLRNKGVIKYIKSLCSDSSVWGFMSDVSCSATHQPFNSACRQEAKTPER